ncbi:MAG TPA: MBOAT family O-acyltransferase [Anaerolineales bacterium]|nr:MBOAT family O-acyltransferase [Anaerolineales bacterium]
MNFNTALFLFLFLPFFLIAYFIAQPRWRPLLGIIASGLFYAWGSTVNLAFITGLILINYGLARLSDSKPSRWILPLGVFINVGVLAFFKLFLSYGMAIFLGLDRFFPERVVNWLGTITFPLGLSFVSFQLIAYLLDVSKGTIKPERNLVSFAFYALMFPKLLAGPIVRYQTVAEQLPAPTLDPNQIADGIRRFLRGFAKKILIADVLAGTVNAVFALPGSALTPTFAWLGLAGYALQIFFDFSGYTDMAIGLASMMGFRFIENFNYPYIAQSIGDFWRRWHISLSTWFRDYVFYPLERRRFPVMGQSINILIVFLLTGLWHGVASSFILWGLLHGLFIALEGLFLNNLLQRTFRPIRHLYVLSVLLLTWLLFRAPSYEYIFDFLRALAGNASAQILLPFAGISPLPFIEPSFVIAFIAGVVLSLPLGPVIQKHIDNSMPLTILNDLMLFALFVLSVAFMTSGKFLPGIYGSF